RFSQPRDFLVLSFDQWIKLRNLLRVLALFMFPKEEEVCVVLRPPSMEEKLVLLENGLAQFCCLLELRPMVHDNAPVAFLVAHPSDYLVVDPQFVITRLEALHLKAIQRRRRWAIGFIWEFRWPTQLRLQRDSLCVVIPIFAFENFDTVTPFAQ